MKCSTACLKPSARAEKGFDGLVIWHEPPFASVPICNKCPMLAPPASSICSKPRWPKFQRASMALKHAQVPTVAAVQGMALGGGCEFVMHAGHRVMALESYCGLVEAGVA